MFGKSHYDRDVTTWSPDGKLHQVDYAKKSLNQGSVCLGILGKDHVVIAAYKRQANKFGSPQKKIFKIDSHMCMAISGLTADARGLASYMRTECLNHKYSYGTPIISGRLCSDIATKSQEKTQVARGRPYGVGLLIGAFDKDGPHLYQTSPCGNLYELRGRAIGDRSNSAETYLVEHQEEFPACSKDDLIKHALQALKNATVQRAADDKHAEPELSMYNASIAIVGSGQDYELLGEEEVKKYLDLL